MPTTQEAIDELEDLLGEFDALIEESGDEEAYAPLVSGADGFLTALVVSLAQVPQDEWLAALLPGIERLLAPEKIARIVALLLARKVVIAGELQRGEAVFEPIYEYDDRHNETLWELWIEGFDQAMQLRQGGWLALEESEDPDLADAFATLVSMLMIARREADGLPEAEEITEQAPDLIPAVAEVLYCHLRGLPTILDAPAPQEPVRVVQIGRNEPCPCGSGKKYKKCCLG